VKRTVLFSTIRVQKFLALAMASLASSISAEVLAAGSIELTQEDNTYYRGEDPTVKFKGHSACPDSSHWGFGMKAVFDDGNFIVYLVCDSNANNTELTCEIPISMYGLGPCAHTMWLRGDVRVPDCGGFHYEEMESNAIRVWLDNPATTAADGSPKTCDGFPDCAEGHVTVSGPVDVATGRMFHQMTDLRIDGPLPIEFTRRFDSRVAGASPLGSGWQHSYMVHLVGSGTRRTLVNEQFRAIEFIKNPSGGWDGTSIDNLRLVQGTDPPWQVVDPHGKK
jgi:hypothetical protein